MAKDHIDTDGLHSLDRLLDRLDHFQDEEEMLQARRGQRLEERFRHLQPDYSEDDIEYF